MWRQAFINLIANYEPQNPAPYFAAEHGPSACGMGWRVRDAARAYDEGPLARGAEPVEDLLPTRWNPACPRSAASADLIIYLIDR